MFLGLEQISPLLHTKPCKVGLSSQFHTGNSGWELGPSQRKLSSDLGVEIVSQLKCIGPQSSFSTIHDDSRCKEQGWLCFQSWGGKIFIKKRKRFVCFKNTFTGQVLSCDLTFSLQEKRTWLNNTPFLLLSPIPKAWRAPALSLRLLFSR